MTDRTTERLQQKVSEDEVARARAGEVMQGLPALDVQDLDACIRWLCRLEQVATITTSAVINRSAILAHFAQGGLTPGMDARRSDERPAAWSARVGEDGKKRWLIGQGLDGVSFVGTPHQVIHHFAKELGIQF